MAVVLTVGLLHQPSEGVLGGAVHSHEEVELALLGADLGDVDVEVADRIGLEGLLGRLVAGDLGQAADAVALQATVQGRPRQVRDRRLQGIEAVIERQQCVLAEGDDHRLFLGRQNRRARGLRTHRRIVNEGSLAPLGDGLLIKAVLRG